ncbi:hypothetical protein ACLVWU_12950 [Bdellovibrio sp. HCB290]|uniref:hypothetical protein n=1 Tax=Bdellovibrio sp. HCB290 TaxID=3394356 RepID=UPI0039B65505
MKRFMFVIIAMLLGTQAHASVTSEEFVDQFVAQMNRRLVFVNQDRIAAKYRPFCTGLNKDQIASITSIVSQNPEQTAEEFHKALSEKLQCYPIAIAPLKREGWGILFNTKAYWMDIKLIRDTLADLGLKTHDSMKSKLLDSVHP